MKVLLIQPPDEKEIIMGYPLDYTRKARSYLPPLGLMYLASFLEPRHEVKVIDMGVMGWGPGGIIPVLDQFQPEIIGIPVIINQWLSVLDLAGAIKKHTPRTPVVVGGPNATLYPVETLRAENIDYLIRGCGQIPLMELCNRLESDGPVGDIDFCYHYGSTHPDLQPPRIINPDIFPFPKRIALPIDSYFVPFCPENPVTSMISSQGCCYRCAFCQCRNSIPIQIRSPEIVVSEMETVQNLGIRSILFQDDLFTINPNRVLVLCQLILKKGIKLHWSIKSRVDCIRDGMPELMKKAGCFNIHFGIESGNPKTLKRMKKDISIEQVRAAVRKVKASGLSCTGNFMLGYPGEDERDIWNTIHFASELNLDMSQFSITMDLPDTELYQDAIKQGRRSGDVFRNFVLDPVNTDISRLFSSDYFTEDEMFKFLQAAYSSVKTLYSA